MVLDMTTHDNFGLAHLSLPDESVYEEPCPIAPQAKHTEILPYLTSESNANPKALKANVPDAEYTFKYNDIDFYRHVNTVRYITILLNRYSLEEFDRNFVNRLELSFLHEGSFGDTVSILRHNSSPLDSAFSLVSHKTGRPVIFADLHWLHADRCHLSVKSLHLMCTSESVNLHHIVILSFAYVQPFS